MQISELLARKAEEAEGHRARAYLRAAGEAMMWDTEAARLLESDIPLTTLAGIGDKLAAKIAGWVTDGVDVPEAPQTRLGFRSLAESLELVASHTEYARPLGDLQMHTTGSDGRNTALEMVTACLERGMEWATITDHSAGQPIPPGLDGDAIAHQAGVIADVRDQTGADVLHGLEMNLTPEGAGDTDPAVLGSLDIVLGSFHSRLRETGDQTARYIKALSNPDIDVLAHPSARKWNRRVGLPADFEKIVHGAAVTGKAIEVDCHPHRQDLRDEHLAYAAECDVMISIGTDSHNTAELRFLPIGIAACIRAGVPTDRILNYRTAAEVRDWVRSRRS